jgi:prepilin-type N-terminal cleavage/methylation domain-containing protein
MISAFCRLRPLRRGLTLVEVMISMTILTIVMSILWQFLQWGLASHRKGEAIRQSQSLARDIAGHLSGQIGTAVPLATFSVPVTPPGINKDFQSAVLWPDPYEDNHSSFASTFYRRERVTESLSGSGTVEVDRVFNRLIFSRPGKEAGSSYNARDYKNFVYIEYLVDESNPSILYRRVYPVIKNPLAIGAGPDGVSLTVGSFQRWVLENFFTITGGSPGSNPNLLANLNTDEQLIAWQLPQKNDRLQFSIAHSKFTPSTPQLPPKVPYFEPSIFNLSVTVSLDKNPGRLTNGDYLAEFTLNEQARVRAGN